MLDENVKLVKIWPKSQNVKYVQSFLGLAGYYRRFIPKFSEIASPMTQLTKRNKTFNWTTTCSESFQKLKDLLIKTPILTFPTTEGHFILDTDESANGIGAVLSQMHNGQERVISYAIKTLNQAEKRYCTTKRELLAVVYFVKHFNHYLWGRHLTVRTDHSSLTWIKNFKNSVGILARWLSILETYYFKIEHRQGVKHANADAFSRIPIRRCPCENCPDCLKKLSARVNLIALNQSTENTESSANNLGSLMQSVSTAEIKNLQANDPSLKPIIDLKREDDENPSRSVLLHVHVSSNQETKILFRMWETLEMKDKILYRVNSNITGDKNINW